MPTAVLFAALSLVLAPARGLAQTVAGAASDLPAGTALRKRAEALSIADGVIQVDGRLSEEVWLRAVPVTEFTQKEPTPNLTLEATFNPDFGQVEADPAEVNLTAFETRFNEKRPFFLEGAPLFNIGHPNFYYSRRIGARPTGPAIDDYVDYPADSTILGAAKLTGRLPSKTSVGILAAVTAEESARLASAALPGIREVRVAPRAYRAVGRVLQEFGPLASTAGGFVSVVHRDVTSGDPLADLLSRNALGLAGNTTLRFKGGEYEFRAQGGRS